MASLEDRGPGDRKRWRVRWRDPDGKARSRSFDRKADAERYRNELSHRLDAGTYLDPNAGRVTVGELADSYLERIDAMRKPTTAASYREVYRALVEPRWERTPVGSVRHTDVATWAADLATRLSASRVRHAHHVLAKILDDAVADRRIPSNPARGVTLPKLPTRREHPYLTHGQVAALADAMPTDRDRALLLLLAYCGLRWGEATALLWGDVETIRPRITVRRAVVEIHGRLVATTPKSGKPRIVPIPGPALEALDRLERRSGLVFPSRTGEPIRNGSWRRNVLSPACGRAGLPEISPHALRHTAASLAVASGATVKAVQGMLGHASAAMTLDVYADLFTDDLDALADRITKAAEAAPGWKPPPSVEVDQKLGSR